jgi:hypothetical protein
MPSRPDDFPGDLWPRAVVILSKLIKKSPNQTHLSELCEQIVTEITPLYCEAVETGKMKADAVLTDRSGMEELLRLFLIHNDPSRSVSGLSNQAWEILQRAKATTWGKLAEAIAKVQQRTANPNPVDGKRGVKTATERHAAVDAYIEEVFQKTGKVIKRSDIWRQARYKTRTEFERWQRNDQENPNKTAHERFTRIIFIEKPHLK